MRSCCSGDDPVEWAKSCAVEVKIVILFIIMMIVIMITLLLLLLLVLLLLLIIMIMIMIIILIITLMLLMLLIPGHALHEKGLHRQKGAGPLVSSQERRVLAVPLINRG